MHFRTLFLLFAFVELTSLTAYFFPTLRTAGFFVIAAAALALSLKRLEYGFYFVLTDLILGGKSGALFSFDYSGFFLSLRMALFIVVMAVWLGKAISAWFHNPSPPPLILRGAVMQWWGIFGLAVLWGAGVGFARGNNFGDLFLDANGYFYGVIVLPAVWVAMRMDANARGEWMRMLGTVFFAATVWLAVKTLLAVYLFTHAGNNFIAANLLNFYRWVRDTGVGEITWLKGNFARVFFQSHVYNIAAFFVLLAGYGLRDWRRWFMLSLNGAVIVVALSRSFWVGVLVGIAALAIVQVKPIRLIGQLGKSLVASGALAVILIVAVARFPFPKPSAIDLGAATRARLQAEAAATSRWNLLPPLWKAVREHLVLGSGFGRTVTYISNDPRIREQSPTGSYTTYAFEWGWLDSWLKMGIIGLIGLLGLIFQIARSLWRQIKNNPLAPAGLAGLAGLAALNVFTPYLNHPLGLGILILDTILVLWYSGESGILVRSSVVPKVHKNQV